jgi:hypothetical protein
LHSWNKPGLLFLAPELVVVIEVRNADKPPCADAAALRRDTPQSKSQADRTGARNRVADPLTNADPKDQDRLFRERFLDGEEIGG